MPTKKDFLDFSKIYSVSKIKLFYQCPQQYWFSYLDPIYSKLKSKLKREPENIFTFQTLGKAVHDAITLFYYLAPGERTKENLKKLLQETWRSEVFWQKKPPLGKWGGFKSLEEERESYKQALELLLKFFKIAELEPNIRYLPTKDLKNSIEDYKNLVIFLDKDYQLSGKFDLILEDKNGLHVIDFKTGKSNDVDKFQLRFYKLLAQENFGRPVIKTSFYFLRKPEVKDFEIKTDKKAIKEEIKEKIREIQDPKEFKPRPSKLCQFCLFRNLCPLKKEVTKIVKKADEEEVPEDLPF